MQMLGGQGRMIHLSLSCRVWGVLAGADGIWSGGSKGSTHHWRWEGVQLEGKQGELCWRRTDKGQ